MMKMVVRDEGQVVRSGSGEMKKWFPPAEVEVEDEEEMLLNNGFEW